MLGFQWMVRLAPKIERKLWHILFKNARLSYAQSGEDMILDTIFYNVVKGCYVDVGANNPYEQSNTQYFYRKGWRGVNIDALPGSMTIFNKVRKHDINIEAAIANDNSELTYYMFESSFYNTFDNKDIELTKSVTKLVGEKKIKTIRLAELLGSLDLPTIHFMSVDVEGLDYQVLDSNNWNKYRPKIIITEFSGRLDLKKDKVYRLLSENRYNLLCQTVTNVFYIEKDFDQERFGKKE